MDNLYIDNILVLGKGSFSLHTDQLIVIFARMCATGFIVNYPKCSFGLKDIPDLRYNITQEGIKPDPKNLALLGLLVKQNIYYQLE